MAAGYSLEHQPLVYTFYNCKPLVIAIICEWLQATPWSANH